MLLFLIPEMCNHFSYILSMSFHFDPLYSVSYCTNSYKCVYLYQCM